MKKIFLYFFTTLTICAIVIVSFEAYQYLAPPSERPYYRIPSPDDTLRIAYIGDSWAFIHQREHQCLIPDIVNNQSHRPSRIYSYGLPGRTSKEVYEAIFDNKEMNSLMRSRGYHFCIVSAGINDANQKMSIKYYKESMDYIIRFLLSNYVRPILFEMPDYNINKIYRWQRTDRKLRYRLSMVINRVPMDCKQLYRNALDDLIQEKDYQDKVSIIRYKSWNKDYFKDLETLYLSDGVHLNDYGYAILDSIIAKEILNETNRIIN